VKKERRMCERERERKSVGEMARPIGIEHGGIVGPACPEPDHGVDGCWVKSDVIGIIKHDNLGTLYVCYDQSPHPKLSIVTDCGLTGDTNHPQTITSYHLVNILGGKVKEEKDEREQRKTLWTEHSDS
jgi:hypothetical protein